MNIAQTGNPASRQSHNVKSAESSVTIPLGSPVALSLSGTGDGLEVVTPNTATAVKAHTFAFGVATQDIAPGKTGNAQVFGVVQKARVMTQTRSATSANWVSVSAPLGCMLNIWTVSNGFSTSGGTMAVSGFLPVAALAESISYGSEASNTDATDAALVTRTNYHKVFVRMM